MRPSVSQVQRHYLGKVPVEKVYITLPQTYLGHSMRNLFFKIGRIFLEYVQKNVLVVYGSQYIRTRQIYTNETGFIEKRTESDTICYVLNAHAKRIMTIISCSINELLSLRWQRLGPWESVRGNWKSDLIAHKSEIGVALPTKQVPVPYNPRTKACCHWRLCSHSILCNRPATTIYEISATGRFPLLQFTKDIRKPTWNISIPTST